MGIVKYLVASVAVIAAPHAAFATTYMMNFNSGVGFVMPLPTTNIGTGFTDTFMFSTVGLMTFSGTLSTQRLRAPATTGPVVSDLDFVSVILDGLYTFDIPTAGTDDFEQARIASTNIAAGSHSLVVTYNVSAADANNGAGYAGLLNVGQATVLPEPASWAMMMLGLGMVGSAARRRRAVSVAA